MPSEHPARAAANRSMDAVQRKDKQAWLDLFAEDAIVEDPIGPSVDSQFCLTTVTASSPPGTFSANPAAD